MMKSLKPRRKPGFFFALLLLLLSACSTSSLTNKTISNSQERGFNAQTFSSDDFMIKSWTRLSDPNQTRIQVYIEGDGFAWQDRYTPSADPTPKNPIAFRMALQDTHANVIYIGRPCQYHVAAHCNAEFWTHKRFAKQVINSTNDILDKLLANHKVKQQIHVIGFSGGGILAGLIAAKRDDVVFWHSIASPLDTQAWIQHHQLSPLTGSENLKCYLPQLKQVQQLHWFGINDRIVPSHLNQSIIEQLREHNNHVQVRFFKGAHHQVWEQRPL